MLFGSYRRGDANDPDRYVTAIAAVLSLYDFDLMREATDPRTGIQTTEAHATFMPQSGELKLYCDGLAARKERLEKLAAIPRPTPTSHRLEAPRAREPGSLANTFVNVGHRRYAELVKWTETADPMFWRLGKSSDGRDGVWVSWDVWDKPPAQQQRATSAPDWTSLKLNPETLATFKARIEPEAAE